MHTLLSTGRRQRNVQISTMQSNFFCNTPSPNDLCFAFDLPALNGHLKLRQILDITRTNHPIPLAPWS